MRRRAAGGTAAFALALAAMAQPSIAEDLVERGRYLTAAGGCISCHTADEDGAAPFAGGRALASDFGTFFGPNITPDRDTGIGAWSEADFLRAVLEGRSPSGAAYFPAFPYPSYAGLTEDDARAIYAYLRTLPAVRRENLEHKLPWHVSRVGARIWQALYFSPTGFQRDPARSETWNRGAYLVRHLGHCGECHTPRNRLGAPEASRELSGNPQGPENRRIPNITPHDPDGIGGWSADEVVAFLEYGMLPDGDFAGAGMGEVIDENTGKLTAADREAIAAYLLALPAVPDIKGSPDG
ncbi:MAG: c-type cytochrome [Gammaproteobacteria bacterium]|nr:c-type cytochrome [Gammaproteobacteria bacterium]